MLSSKAHKFANVISSIFFVGLCFLLLSACIPSSQSSSLLTENMDATSENPTITTSLTPEKLVIAGTLAPTSTIKASSQTPEPIPPTTTIESLTTPSPTPQTQTVAGDLFIYNIAGIQRVSITDGTAINLLTPEDNWLDWGAGFAQNKKLLVYWIKHANVTELWLTQLPDWQPELILEIENVAYDFATPMWGVNDRYLLFDLSIVDNSGEVEDINTIRNYIIDIEKMELVHEPYWPGECSILATSPQTDQLSLWCYQSQEQEILQEFLVLEPEKETWIASQSPEPMIENCLTQLVCAWSHNNGFVAYVGAGYPETLFYTMVSHPMPISLDDKLTRIFSFPSWSPDGHFLYYSGACADGTIQCPNIMRVTDQEVIWRATDNSNRGKYGNISVSQSTWSPNGHYIAIPISPNMDSRIEERILILDIMTQQEVSKISQMVNEAVLDMVWVTD